MRLIILTLTSNLGRFLAHLVPNGTPLFLVSFIVFIELISNVIRPLTLGVRLAANITAGHLLIALLASLDRWTVSVSLQIILFVLEIAVGLIQAYVFALLRFLYFTEA
jgi:ATP synthase subunit 6